MEAQKKNPALIAGLISLIPQAIQTVSTIIKDKKEKKQETSPASAEQSAPPSEKGELAATTAGAVIESVKDMVSGSISSKRVLNIGGTALIISVALTDVTAHGITKLNLALIGIGVLYSLGMSIITWLSERK